MSNWNTDVTDQGMSNTGGVYVTVTNDDGVTIAHVLCTDHTGNRSPLPYQDNALLIAAAPDMLEALRQFADHYPTGVNPYLDKAAISARAAITKATGETQ